MKGFIRLTKRNCLVFLRDRAAVFFSLLAMFIVLMLMGVFLGNMNEENVLSILEQYGGARDALLDQEHARELVQYWTLAGILVVNAVTVTLSVIGNRVADISEGKLAAIYSAPVGRNIIALSYMASAVLIGVVMCVLTLGIALCYIVAAGGEFPTPWMLVRIFLLIVLNVCIFSIIMYLCALFIKSTSAWSGIATVVGTLVGFVGAIYLPMGFLPDGVAAVIKYIPILHGTSLMRQVCCEEALEKTFTKVPVELISEYREYMGIRIKMGDGLASPIYQILFITGCGIIAAAVVMIVQKRKQLNDR